MVKQKSELSLKGNKDFLSVTFNPICLTVKLYRIDINRISECLAFNSFNASCCYQ